MNLTAPTRPGELDCCRARLTSEPAAAAGACSRVLPPGRSGLCH
jgi:hypothetical protein